MNKKESFFDYKIMFYLSFCFSFLSFSLSSFIFYYYIFFLALIKLVYPTASLLFGTNTLFINGNYISLIEACVGVALLFINNIKYDYSYAYFGKDKKFNFSDYIFFGY